MARIMLVGCCSVPELMVEQIAREQDVGYNMSVLEDGGLDFGITVTLSPFLLESETAHTNGQQGVSIVTGCKLGLLAGGLL